MLGKIKSIFSEKKEDEIIPEYKPVPFTVKIAERKYEELQRKKYDIRKDKSIQITSFESDEDFCNANIDEDVIMND